MQFESDEVKSVVSKCPTPAPGLNYRPVIGILTHPGDGATGRLDNRTGVTNIPASYVKLVESAGARVIPLIHTDRWNVTREKLNLVNGVLFTGGWAKEGLYFDTARKIFQVVLEKNDAGEHFPLYGICLGFELISMFVTGDHGICERFSGKNQASILQFTNIAEIPGSVFERFPSELLTKLSTECLALQNHMFGLSPKRLLENDKLSRFFRIVTTTPDDEGQIYVSTAQGLKYPVTGFQWHPEKNAFEWGPSWIPHSEDAILVTQHVANYLVREARRSSNRPPDQKVRDSLIYNYPPTYGGKAGRGYDEVYIFR